MSDEARRLISETRQYAFRKGRGGTGLQHDATARALTAYVAGLELEVARLRDLASGAVFHFFCCGSGIHTEEDDCGQFVPVMADLAKAIGFDAVVSALTQGFRPPIKLVDSDSLFGIPSNGQTWQATRGAA